MKDQITTPADIDILLTVPTETRQLEFKRAERSFSDEELMRYCVALANEGGGRLVLGVTNAIPRTIVGTQAFMSIPTMEQRVWEMLKIKVRGEDVSHQDGRVLVVHIPSRPQGQALSYKGTYLMRAGESLVPMTWDQVVTIHNEGQIEWALRWSRTSCTAEQVVALLDTQCYFKQLGRPYPSDIHEVLRKCEADKLIQKEDEESWAITNLGALLCAKDLDDFDPLGGKAVRVIVYEGRNKVNRVGEKVFRTGYLVGFEGVLKHIVDIMPVNEVLQDALNAPAKMIPDVVIKELLSNALIHQDLQAEGGALLVELYQDRIEVSNPGIPEIDCDRFIDEQKARNERIANLMRKAGICDEVGRGVDVVVASAETHQLPAPEFRVGSVRTTAVVYFHKAFENMKRPERIRAAYQHCVLRHLLGETLTNQSLRERFKLNDEQVEAVSRLIGAAVDQGRIRATDESADSFKYREYVPYWA